jgi:hypothetical protein
VRGVSDSPLTAQDIRAAAEVHRELGADYGDAVVESFLSRIDAHIAERVEQRLAGLAKPRRRSADPVRLSRYRTVFAGVVIGSVVAGMPLSLAGWWLIKDAGGNAASLLLVWLGLVVVYGLAASRLRRR